ncbi:MAG: hypothetical protein ACLPPF_15000 [Rhodomicrobium sp.]
MCSKVIGLTSLVVIAAFSAGQALAQTSINTTSQGRPVGTSATLSVAPLTENGSYQILASNDLGMHCGDLDHRIASILPPFNNVHIQVLQKGTGTTTSTVPQILNASTGASVIYSASSNPNDPALNPSLFYSPTVASALLNGGISENGQLIYKNDFWQTAVQSYGPFYPGGVPTALVYLPPLLPGDPTAADIGLPVPNIETYRLNSNGTPRPVNAPGPLVIGQATMPDAAKVLLNPLNNGPSAAVVTPYLLDTTQTCHGQYTNFPFFNNFAFGYVAMGVNWFAAEGTPMSPIDDQGRTNPYPLMRFQAKVGASVVASTDVVLPVSAEADCQGCHISGYGLTASTGGNCQSGTYQCAVTDDPLYGKVPLVASQQWAAYAMILKLHDNNLKTTLWQGYNASTGIAKNVVACQRCHYTPALDLLQIGPQGTDAVPVNASLQNGVSVGLTQLSHESMSRALHEFHGTHTHGTNTGQVTNVTLSDGTVVPVTAPNDGSPTLAFWQMAQYPMAPISATNPPLTAGQGTRAPNSSTGGIGDWTEAVMYKSCYNCHPGQTTKCLRGPMTGAGLVCQDCHGDMPNVGNDFSQCVSNPNNHPANCPNGTGAGKFTIAADFYTNPNTPRVPWLNEPTCGSCHTGDAFTNNLSTAQEAAVVNSNDAANNTGNATHASGPTTIRLLQTYLTTDSKKTPIITTTQGRFAEPRTANTGGQTVPQLMRLSTGHGGVFCEGCHGPTHAEYPILNESTGLINVNANDNLYSTQHQGHTGKLIECNVCHNDLRPVTPTNSTPTNPGGDALGGPHGMHPVGDQITLGDQLNTINWINNHHNVVDPSGTGWNQAIANECRSCHGVTGEGTVLSVVAENRNAVTFGGAAKLLTAGTQLACTTCHGTSPLAKNP